jgi:hypothetical protein
MHAPARAPRLPLAQSIIIKSDNARHRPGASMICLFAAELPSGAKRIFHARALSRGRRDTPRLGTRKPFQAFNVRAPDAGAEDRSGKMRLETKAGFD